MHLLLSALLSLLLVAPEEPPAPAPPAGKEAAAEPRDEDHADLRAVVAGLTAKLKAGDLVDLYDRLSKNGRKQADLLLARAAGFLALGKNLSGRDVAAVLEKRLRNEDQEALQTMATVRVRILSIRRTGGKADLAIDAQPRRGKKVRFDLRLVKEGGHWKVDQVQPRMEVRLDANETATIATMRNIVSAQAQFQATGVADVNNNGVGEYGFFGELSAGAAVRGKAPMNPPVLSRAFRAVSHGMVTRNGYNYRIYLPGKKGPVVEPAAVKEIDAARAEVLWCVYAWPVEYGKTGTRTFFMNQMGDVLATDAKRYSGANGPSPSAAFRASTKDGDAAKANKSRESIDGATAIGAKGNDGNTWKQAG